MICILNDSIFCTEFKNIDSGVIQGHIKVIERSNSQFEPQYMRYTYILNPKLTRNSNLRPLKVNNGEGVI